MSGLSILLIDDQISTAAEVVQAVGQHLPEYSLAVAQGIGQAVAEPEAADIILLKSTLLTTDPAGCLSALRRSYPHTFITLLQATFDDDQLLPALAAGANDYIPFSAAGLVVLGRRLASLAFSAMPQPGATDTTDLAPIKALESVLGTAQSPLAVQMIGVDNLILAWNLAMERFSGLSQEAVIGRSIDDLPLSPTNLSRLKDILDQARITREPFTISDYPVEDQSGRTRWARIYVYPVIHSQAGNTSPQPVDVCIIGLDVSDLKQQAVESWQYTRELRLLLEISREVSEQLDLQSTLEKIAEQAKSLLNAATCHIYFLERDNQTLRPVLSIGPNAEQIKNLPRAVGQSLLGSVTATGKAILLNAADTQLQPNLSFIQDQHLLCAPLTALRGIIGMLAISRHERQPPFMPEELDFFENLVGQASLAINNARLFEETQRNLNELAIFYEASAAVSTTWNTQEVLNTLIGQMVRGMEVSQGHIVNWNKSQRQGTVQAIFVGDKSLSQADRVIVGQTFSLTDRPAVAVIMVAAYGH